MTDDLNPDAYGKLARFYDSVMEPLNRPLRDVAVAISSVEPPMSVLDVGCGTGGLVEAFVDAGATVTGVDLSEAMLNEARERVGTSAELHIGSATDLPFADGSFDLVTASLFLHELDPATRERALTEMARVTAANGTMLVIDYRVGSLRAKGRVMRGISTVAERVAGRVHHRNWKTYMGTGGIASDLSRLGFTVEREKIVAGGNLSLTLISPHASPSG